MQNLHLVEKENMILNNPRISNTLINKIQRSSTKTENYVNIDSRLNNKNIGTVIPGISLSKMFYTCFYKTSMILKTFSHVKNIIKTFYSESHLFEFEFLINSYENPR